MAGVELLPPQPQPPQQAQALSQQGGVGCGAAAHLQHQAPLEQASQVAPHATLQPAAPAAAVPPPPVLYRVGCALLPKKVSRYLTASMRAVASQQGVELVQIDYNRSLLEQGTFDAIIHKLRPSKEWERNLLEYVQVHPHVTVIDSVDSIRTLHNRATMLTPLQGQGVRIDGGAHHPNQTACVQAPHQVEILEGTTLEQAQRMLQEANLTPPLLVKPLWTDGREGSHGLGVLHDMEALGRLLSGQVSRDLQPPLVVQQFVEHGGVLFKVYVLGDKTVVSRRPSLGDKYLGQDARRQGILQLPRISCKSVYAQQQHQQQHQPPHQQQPHQQPAQSAAAPATQPALGQPRRSLGSYPAPASGDAGAAPQGAAQAPCAAAAAAASSALSTFPLPPEWVTHSLATVLRQRLGLQLFNFDLIRPEQQAGAPEQCLYYVIDINYFPGVDKIPNFEHVFVAFLKQACARRGGAAGALQRRHSAGVSAGAAGEALLPLQQRAARGGGEEAWAAERKASGGKGSDGAGAEGLNGQVGVGGQVLVEEEGEEDDDGEPHVEVVEEVDDEEEDVEGSSTEDGSAGPPALGSAAEQQQGAAGGAEGR